MIKISFFQSMFSYISTIFYCTQKYIECNKDSFSFIIVWWCKICFFSNLVILVSLSNFAALIINNGDTTKDKINPEAFVWYWWYTKTSVNQAFEAMSVNLGTGVIWNWYINICKQTSPQQVFYKRSSDRSYLWKTLTFN